MDDGNAASRWDGVAGQFNDLRIPSWEEDLFLKTIGRIPVWDKDARIMDLGCGAGRYSIAVADRCGHVLGSDVSPKMLEFAEAKKKEYGKANITFVNESWHDVDIRAAGYEKHFDLIFGHMTPAFESISDIEKANAASRGYCALATFAQREAPVAERFYDFMGTGPDRWRENRIPGFFEYLYDNKYYPVVNYYLRDDTQQFDEEKAVHFLKDRYVLDSGAEPGEEVTERIREFVRSEMKDSIFVNEVHAVIVTMVWKVKEGQNGFEGYKR